MARPQLRGGYEPYCTGLPEQRLLSFLTKGRWWYFGRNKCYILDKEYDLVYMVNVGSFLNSNLHASFIPRNSTVLMTFTFSREARFSTRYRISKIVLEEQLLSHNAHLKIFYISSVLPSTIHQISLNRLVRDNLDSCFQIDNVDK